MQIVRGLMVALLLLLLFPGRGALRTLDMVDLGVLIEVWVVCRHVLVILIRVMVVHEGGSSETVRKWLVIHVIRLHLDLLVVGSDLNRNVVVGPFLLLALRLVELGGLGSWLPELPVSSKPTRFLSLCWPALNNGLLLLLTMGSAAR
jgi:hypothetical protein